jgi:hypothetical protein
MVPTPFVVVGRQDTPVEGAEVAKGCGVACSMSAAVDRLVEGHNLDFGIVVPKAQYVVVFRYPQLGNARYFPRCALQ